MPTKVNPMVNLVLLATLVTAAILGAKIDKKMLSDRHEIVINNGTAVRIPNNPTKQQPVSESQQLLELATVRRGKGIESTLIKQLVVEPYLVVDTPANRKIGLSPFKGDASDKAALKQWAGRQAHLIAIGKYVDSRSGAEIRVKRVGAVYLLRASADGTLSVDEYPPTPSGTGQVSGPTHTNELASNIAHAQFKGWTDNLVSRQLPAYEYLQQVAE